MRIDGSSQCLAGFLPVEFRWGSDVRGDDIGDIALYRTVARQRIGSVRRDSVIEFSLSGYGDFGLELSNNLRVSLGLRADCYPARDLRRRSKARMLTALLAYT